MKADKLVETIKLVVRSELKKTLKPMLKEVLKPLVQEYVEAEVNAVLAEKFIQTITTNQSLVKEIAPQVSMRTQQAVQNVNPVIQNKQISEDRRREILRKLGVEQDPMAQLIYGDIDISNEPPLDSQVINEHDQIGYDPEDYEEGVDISVFGFGK